MKKFGGYFKDFPNGTYYWEAPNESGKEIILIAKPHGFWVQSILPFMTPFREIDWTLQWSKYWIQQNEL